MAIRMSRLAPRLALTPALAITFVAFFLSIVWTIYMSFTRSRQLPDYAFNFADWSRQYERLFNDQAWATSLKNLLILGIGSALAIVFGFVLAALINREKRIEGFFRTVFLYPLAVSLIVTGLVWRWMMNPGLGIENALHEIGWTNASDGSPWLIYLRITDDQFLEIFPGAEQDRAPASWRANGVTHICLTVVDIDDVVKRLTAKGVKLLLPLKDGADGNRQAWIEDPDGNRIELMEMMPGCLKEKAIARLRAVMA
jgi:ABC-type sugar transport system permease subunit